MTSALLLAILTITTFERSYALMPATSEDGSGVDPPEVITVRYCIIDNSTILRLDTGDQLDVIYTKDNTLVVTIDGSLTAIEVSRSHSEQVCSVNDLPVDIVVTTPLYIFVSMWNALILSITGYNIVIHLLYKKLRSPMGKLLMLYSISLALSSGVFFMIVTFVYKFPISSNFNHLCHLVKLVGFGANVGYEAIASCLLAQSVYLLRQSYKMIPINPREDKVVWRRYLYYIIGTIAIAMLVVVTYDVGTAEGRYYGYCSKHDPMFFTMITIMLVFSLINAPIQIALFIIYLWYWYKMRNSWDITDYQINKKLFRIAIAMGATISVAKLFFVIDWIIILARDKEDKNFTPLTEFISSVSLLIQHCVLVGSLRWVKHVYKAFCKKEAEPAMVPNSE